MKLIPLTKGYEAMVDDEDYTKVMQYSWRVAFFHRSTTLYALRSLPRDGGTRKGEYLHNCILAPPINMTWDHIDHNGLNCQKYNLRLATKSQQMINNHASMPYGYRGVSPYYKDRWRARVIVNRKEYYKLCDTPEEAARAYDELAKQHHGEFAVLNFPGDK